ncbi:MULTISPECIES: WXG100 family type VII secretion target [Kitasatospora]|uniref:WXG100 family type VII secretion target n=1 Tax=Kitasatospora TaxID=2063 RepID=UPI000C70D08A|nr:WXG100 family type VII secretion target [Kitasatospora sp. GP30]MDH6144796.1 WXG100 family type VII secretion target [Kitasatospora sp. GP30]
MAGQFTTTAEEMRALSARITQVNDQITAEVGKLNQLIDEVAGGWQGQAATAYHALQTKWNDDVKALNQVLNDIRGAIDATTKNYSTTEDDQRGALSSVPGA